MKKVNHRELEFENETGAHLVLLSVLSLALVFFCLYVIGIGYYSTAATRMQNLGNLAALGAIEAFMSGGPTIVDRANDARARANEILDKPENRVVGLQTGLGELGFANAPGASGHIRFGQWWGIDPQDGTDPCGGPTNYPCFAALEDNPADMTVMANAIEVNLQNQASNLFSFAFDRLIGGSNKQIQIEAKSAIVQRCVGLGMDVSLSVTQDTHRVGINDSCTEPSCFVGDGAPPVFLIKDPQHPALAFFRGDRVGASLPSCTTPPISWDEMFFCNLGPYADRPFVRPDPATDAGWRSYIHYRTDYKRIHSPFDFSGNGNPDRVWVDSYVDPGKGYMGPQPLTRQLLAFNAALRAVGATQTSGDGAFAYIFTGTLRDRVPDTGLTKDFGFLQQLTNANHRGTYTWDQVPVTPVKHPNFVDRGWIPLFYLSGEIESETNIVASLDSMIDTMVNDCPAGSQKSIILATDGLMTCSRDGAPGSSSTCYGTGAQGFLQGYRVAKGQLANNHPNGTYNGYQTVLSRMVEEKIALTVLLDGLAIGANVRNIPHDGYFMDYDDAVAFGYGGFHEPNPDLQYVNFAPVGGSNQDAFINAPNGGYLFRDPLGLFSQMSIDTGGRFCALLPNCEDVINCSLYGGCYEPDPDGGPDRLKAVVRQAMGTWQTCAVQDLSKSEQAAACAVDTIGRNPFILVAEDLP